MVQAPKKTSFGIPAVAANPSSAWPGAAELERHRAALRRSSALPTVSPPIGLVGRRRRFAAPGHRGRRDDPGPGSRRCPLRHRDRSASPFGLRGRPDRASSQPAIRAHCPAEPDREPLRRPRGRVPLPRGTPSSGRTPALPGESAGGGRELPLPRRRDGRRAGGGSRPGRALPLRQVGAFRNHRARARPTGSRPAATGSTGRANSGVVIGKTATPGLRRGSP